jgi:hypothetical protein
MGTILCTEGEVALFISWEFHQRATEARDAKNTQSFRSALDAFRASFQNRKRPKLLGREMLLYEIT